MSVTDDVIVEGQGRLGLLTLDRPKALNALTLEMIATLDAALVDFEHDDAIDAVLIRSGGGRAFCAGGDVKGIAMAPPGPERERARRDLFAREYAVNYLIHRYPKPVLVLADGITMGGGCGLAMNSSHRVATERTLIAMPEVMLGLFPDVGATFFFNRMPGEMGVYVALTGLRLGGGDARALGLATHHVESAALPALTAALVGAERLDPATIGSILATFASPFEASPIAPRQRRVDALFAGETPLEIVAALEAAPEDWAQEALSTVRRACPTSVAATLRQLRNGIGLTPEEMFRTEYRMAVRLSGRDDFREGVRAVLVDKDHAPRWQPGRLEDVDPAAIDSVFAPLAPAEPELELV